MTAVAHAPLAAEIVRVGKLGHLTAAHLADATGGDPSSAIRWLRRTQTPSGAHAAQALELASLVERLAQVVQPTYIPIWLIKPIERLDDRRPVDVIRAGGYPQRVAARRITRRHARRVGCPPSTSTPAASTTSSSSIFRTTGTRSTSRPSRPTAAGSGGLACQQVGDALHDDGYDALLVASAARQMSPICSAFADTAAGELQGRRGSFLIAGQRLRPFVRW